RTVDEQAAAHRNDLAQLADEFDTLRRKRDALAAQHAELSGSREAAESSLRAELGRLTEERDQLRERASAEASRSSELSGRLEALQADLEAARSQATNDRVRVHAAPAPGAAGVEARLAEVQSQLERAEESRSALADALKVAQDQIRDLTIDLDDSQRETRRI